MIYTVTPDPSVEFNVRLWDALNVGGLNRSAGDSILAGGRGISCAVMLHRLGQEVTSLGFLGGAAGDIIRDFLVGEGVICTMDILEGSMTRVSVSIRDVRGTATEIRGKSPCVSAKELASLLERLTAVERGDTVILSGEASESVPESVYRSIALLAADRGAHIVLNTSAELAADMAELRPLAVMTTPRELSRIFGKKTDKEIRVAEFAYALCLRGAHNVLVSMEDDGAMLAAEDKSVYTVPAVAVKTVGYCCRSDSLLAGFTAAYLDSGDRETALRMGNAAACASAACGTCADRLTAEELFKVSKGTVTALKFGAAPLVQQ